MPRYPEKIRLSGSAGLEPGYRPPTPYPIFERAQMPSYGIPSANPRSTRRSSRSYSYINATRYRYDDDIQRKIDEQNANIAKRPRQFDSHRDGPKRVRSVLRKGVGSAVPKSVRFSLPVRRRDMDEEEALAWEFAKLSIREPDSRAGRRRCSRCGQKL
jgi:hypothetical protein